MPRPSKGARLYLRNDSGVKTWIIRHANASIRTGLFEHQKLDAMRALAEYKSNRPIPPKPLQGNGLIYFVTALGSAKYPIKIGWTASTMIARLLQMQGGNPNTLTAVASFAGTQDDERSLHMYFRHLRIRSEWFLRAPELLEYIAELPGQEMDFGVDEFEGISVQPHALNFMQPSETGTNGGLDGEQA